MNPLAGRLGSCGALGFSHLHGVETLSATLAESSAADGAFFMFTCVVSAEEAAQLQFRLGGAYVWDLCFCSVAFGAAQMGVSVGSLAMENRRVTLTLWMELPEPTCVLDEVLG